MKTIPEVNAKAHSLKDAKLNVFPLRLCVKNK